jgi:hypothetical protein
MRRGPKGDRGIFSASHAARVLHPHFAHATSWQRHSVVCGLIGGISTCWYNLGKLARAAFAVRLKLGYVYNLVYIAPSDNPLNLNPNYDAEFGHLTYFGAPASVTGRQITVSYDWTGTLGGDHFSPQDGLV